VAAKDVWNTVQGSTNPLGFKNWPNPINYITEINVLQCQNGWMAEIVFAAAAFANFFWTSFVPSPSEIFRKTFFGGYRCGFYNKAVRWAPMDIVWGQGTTRMLASIASPPVTAVFYWWVSETAASFLATWSSIIFREELCEENPYDAAAVHTNSGLMVNDIEGYLALGEIVYDRTGLMEPGGVRYEIPSDYYWTARAYGMLLAAPGKSGTVRVAIRTSSGIEVSSTTLQLGNTDDVTWSLGASGQAGGGGDGVGVYVALTGLSPIGLPGVRVETAFWAASASPSPFPPFPPSDLGSSGPDWPLC